MLHKNVKKNTGYLKGLTRKYNWKKEKNNVDLFEGTGTTNNVYLLINIIELSLEACNFASLITKKPLIEWEITI